jgi:catechol 2,3-dioxygenase-like lactoylglutathione lyase family enzyme
MISGLRGVTIWSEDLNTLLPFYRDVLGLRVSLQTEGFVVLGDQGTATLALGTHSQVRGRNVDPARHMVGLSTDAIDADWKRLKAAGVEFIEDPTDYGPLRIAAKTRKDRTPLRACAEGLTRYLETLRPGRRLTATRPGRA